MNGGIGLGFKLGFGGGDGGGVVSMLTASCGNSISAAGQFQTGTLRWNETSEMVSTSILGGNSMYFQEVTPTTYADKYGAFGFSGATLDAINAELQVNWFDQFSAASITPGLAVGLALVENDIFADASTATISGRIDTWIASVKAAWFNVTILLCTPRPSFDFDTAGRKSVYLDVTNYMLSLDDGVQVFTTQLDGYEDPGTPAEPLAGYTDASVHPNALGAQVNARDISDTLARITATKQPTTGTIESINRFLSGSQSATASGITGTKPLDTAISISADRTIVSTAEEDGWLIELTQTNPVGNTELGTINIASTALSSPTYISPYMTVEIVSGAENIRTLQLEPRIADGGGNTFHQYQFNTSADVDKEYQNGDVLYFYQPPQKANSGNITGLTNYLRPRMKGALTATFRVVESAAHIPNRT